MSYRENAFADDDSRSPWRLADLIYPLVALASVMLLLAYTAHMDDEAATQARRLAEQREPELQVQALALRDAYAAGQADAMAALRTRPEGLQLAQACVASGFARKAVQP